MALRKPLGNAGNRVRLTDIQDTVRRGDRRLILMSFKLPSDLKEELAERAEEMGTTSTRLIIDGIRMVLKETR